MAKAEKIKKQRKHKILNKPVLAGILLIIWGFSLSQIIPSMFVNPDTHEFASNVVCVLMGILGLLIHRLWFRPEYKGSFANRWLGDKDVRNSIIIFCVIDIISIIYTISVLGVNFNPVFIVLALSAGLSEEMAVRALPISVMMRDWMDEKHIVFIAVFTTVIFGLLHLSNLAVGASIGITIVQLIISLGFGFFFAAVYLRTGNLMITIILHSLHDFFAFITAGNTDNNGVMAQATVSAMDVVQSLLLSAVFVALGIYMLRKSARPKILEVWKERWSVV